jgi:hypothetical protein
MSRISNLILELRMNYHQSGPSTSEPSEDSEVFLSYFRCLMFDSRQQEELLSRVLMNPVRLLLCCSNLQ